MLTRCTREVMSAVYCLCDGTDGCLVSPFEILSLLPRKKYSKERVDGALYELKDDGYIDFIPSERKGERMYLISLKESGLAYKRNEKQHRQDIAFKILLALIGATATFVFGLILRAIF